MRTAFLWLAVLTGSACARDRDGDDSFINGMFDRIQEDEQFKKQQALERERFAHQAAQAAKDDELKTWGLIGAGVFGVLVLIVLASRKAKD